MKKNIVMHLWSREVGVASIKSEKLRKAFFSVFLLLFTYLNGFSQDVVMMIGPATKQPAQFNFYYTDELAMGHPKFLSKNTEKMNITRPVLFIEADKNQNCYLINPGDTLELTKADGAIKSTVLRKNKKYSESDNNEFLFFSRLISDIGPMRFPFICPEDFKKQITKTEREQKIRELYQGRQNYLKDYAVKYKISAEFSSYCESLFSGLLVQQILSLCRNTEGIDPLSVVEYASSFDLLKKELVPYPVAVNNIEYQKALILLSYLLTNTTKMEDYATTSKLISKKFSGADQDFLLGRYMLMAMKSEKISGKDRDLLIANYQEKAPNSPSKDLILENYRNMMKVKKASLSDVTMLTDQEGKRTSWNKLLETNKGKVIYVDFWASWCAPCKAEMPASKLLVEAYRGQKIEFVYISLDEKTADWKESARNLKLPPIGSYLAEGNFSSKLVRDLKISTIPRYVLVNKSGKIVMDNASRPSEQEVKAQIEKLIKE